MLSDTAFNVSISTDAEILSNVPSTSKESTDICDILLECTSTVTEINAGDTGSCVAPPLPKVNAPEKIIICIDMSSELDEVPFRLGDGYQYTPLTIVKRTVNIFVQGKNIINPRHEFAIVTLRETAAWEVDFTSDVTAITSFVGDLEDTSTCESFGITIASNVSLPNTEQSELTTPPFVIRTLLVYGRSSCIPKCLSGMEFKDTLMKCQYFFLDVVYIHLPPSDTNSSETIFKTLCDLDQRGTSYILEVTRNTTKLHDYMAKLLAHPLQRSPQSLVDRVVSISPAPSD